MLQFLKNRWPLLILLSVFIACKIPHLFYPYFWDESWPYVPAIHEMYQHGISLLPGAVQPDLSRGHPLFFHAIGALWINIFGTSHLSLHSFALFISLATLVSLYEAGFRLFNKRVAFLTSFLVAAQTLFFVQSSFVLLEILLALLCFLSLYFYTTERYIIATLCLTAAFFTKESGLVAGFVIGIDALIRLFSKRIPLKKRIASVLTVVIPVIMISLFFLLQKKINGWYIFPLYNNLIEHSLDSFLYKFRMACLYTIFVNDYRYYTMLLFGFLGLIAAIKTQNARYIALIALFYFSWIMISDERTGHYLPAVLFSCFFVSLAATFYCFHNLKYYTNPTQKRFVVICTFFSFAFIVYTPMNLFINRYLLTPIVPLFFVLAVFFDFFIKQVYGKIYFVILPVLLYIALISYRNNHAIGDTGRNAFRAMDVQQDVVTFLEKENLYDAHISSHSFLQREHLTDPVTGFLHSGKIFRNVQWDIDSNTEYIIFDNIEPDYRLPEIEKDSAFEIAYQKNNWEVWGKIYRRKSSRR